MHACNSESRVSLNIDSWKLKREMLQNNANAKLLESGKCNWKAFHKIFSINADIFLANLIRISEWNEQRLE